MVQFTKLRLAGFKSFVDPTELLIEPGLTGVVGPNGCGKSNLLEGLRWAMGEGSAKQMRGGEMDDVIFSGSSTRPPRNIAEVTIQLDNARRDAPGGYADSEDLEIVRRIERGSGSTYRINGRDVRARDVHLLFADLSTGPRSTAIVSQGRVGGLINAKPVQRRLLLEEAAGITGLHSRRHEAELRLRAAEGNLERLDDVLGALEGQLQGLKRQARQAARYRSINDRIRQAEAVQLYLRWTEASAEREAARERLDAAEALVSKQMSETAQASTAHADAAANLGPLRQAESEAAAQLHRLVVAREALDAEEERLAAARRDVEVRLTQIDADLERERALIAEAATALERLADESGTLEEAGSREAEERESAARDVDAAAERVATLDEQVSGLTRQLAAADARRTTLERRLEELTERCGRLNQRLESVDDARAEADDGGNDDAALSDAKAAVTDAAATVETTRADAEALEEARHDAEAGAVAAREHLQQAEEARAKLQAEEKALAELLTRDAPTDLPPVLNEVTVEPGYETALGVALGDDLTAPVDERAPIRWSHATDAAQLGPALPPGAEPLSRFVAGPAALTRRLAQIGVVADADAGERLRVQMKQGQRLVTRGGALWRWDGFAIAAGTSTSAAKRLQQQNRLADVRKELNTADSAADTARHAFEAARDGAESIRQRAKHAAENLRQAFADLNEAREGQSEIAERVAATLSRRAALEETAERLAGDLAEAESERANAEAALADLPALDAEQRRLDALKEELSQARAAHMEKRQDHNRLELEATRRRERRDAISREDASWRQRRAGGEDQVRQLDERKNAAEAELERLAGQPDELRRRRSELNEKLSAAEAARKETGDRLAEAEARVAELDRGLKAAEAALADAREARGRCDGDVRQADTALESIIDRIAERLDCRPPDVFAQTGLKGPDDLPDRESIDARLDRLYRERDGMGPVNLRAEQEARELEEQIETLGGERDDLISAIGRLRQGIGELNREGRQRLLASFDTVDAHFQELFVRMFGGGTAHLKLVESDDPLEAGLEIMAQPPGKRLQTLSLLSGGEQALTALSLLFAVFLTNPAPICILDEVDAPLDDNNVGRFCDLISDIAHSSATRFMLITHHRLTMARVDRLYGVTMPERGVSQLVSVDLRRAEQMRESA